jgi:hypothetical protein
MMQADFDRSIQKQDAVEPGRGAPCPAVGQALRRAGPLDAHAQYLADLEVIERCERQIEEQAGCPDFFGCMGELRTGRVHG